MKNMHLKENMLRAPYETCVEGTTRKTCWGLHIKKYRGHHMKNILKALHEKIFSATYEKDAEGSTWKHVEGTTWKMCWGLYMKNMGLEHHMNIIIMFSVSHGKQDKNTIR